MRKACSRRDLLNVVMGRVRDCGVSKRPSRDTSSIAGDFTPEMLAMEAQRLGLDTNIDREAMLAAVLAAMQPREEENGPTRPEK